MTSIIRLSLTQLRRTPSAPRRCPFRADRRAAYRLRRRWLRLQTRAHDGVDILGHYMAVAGCIERHPPGFRLSRVAVTHAREQRKIPLVPVAVLGFPTCRHLGLDVEQKGDVGLW